MLEVINSEQVEYTVCTQNKYIVINYCGSLYSPGYRLGESLICKGNLQTEFLRKPIPIGGYKLESSERAQGAGFPGHCPACIYLLACLLFFFNFLSLIAIFQITGH